MHFVVDFAQKVDWFTILYDCCCCCLSLSSTIVTFGFAAFSGDLDPSLPFFPGGDADLALIDAAAASSTSISSSTLLMAALMVWAAITHLPNFIYRVIHQLSILLLVDGNFGSCADDWGG